MVRFIFSIPLVLGSVDSYNSVATWREKNKYRMCWYGTG
jgi:hypothetical protein